MRRDVDKKGGGNGRERNAERESLVTSRAADKWCALAYFHVSVLSDKDTGPYTFTLIAILISMLH